MVVCGFLMLQHEQAVWNNVVLQLIVFLILEKCYNEHRNDMCEKDKTLYFNAVQIILIGFSEGSFIYWVYLLIKLYFERKIKPDTLLLKFELSHCTCIRILVKSLLLWKQ